MMRCFSLSLFLLIACRDPATAPAPSEVDRRAPYVPRSTPGDSITYELDFADASRHYVGINAVYPSAGLDAFEVMLPVWTPGSYMVREFSRHIESVEASTLDGAPLDVRKVRKNRWRIEAGDQSQVVLRYRVYCRELSVRTSFVDRDLAVLNGATLFLGMVDHLDRIHHVTLNPPEGWLAIETSLSPAGGPHRYEASNYDVLIDSPIAMGTAAVREFTIDGVPHRLASFGDASLWDSDRAATDVRRIVETQVGFWRSLPYERYVFLNMLDAESRGGGLEHLSSTALFVDLGATRDPESYRHWLSLVSHEFFHTWNVKRLRPVALGPFDYENEVYTRDLWIAEGFTAYYQDLLLARASLLTDDEYLAALSENIASVQGAPGRLVHPLSEASFDAWVKFYRSDENTQNTSVSYYAKGATVAFLLDVEIRVRTDGTRSLDDVMRLAYERYSGERGYASEEFRAVVDEVAGEPMAAFFENAVDGRGELDFAPALEFFGLRFQPSEAEGALSAHGPNPRSPPRGYLGVESRNEGGRVLISRVVRDSPAAVAGINVDDEILAIDGFRVRDLSATVGRFYSGETVNILVARRGRVLELAAQLGASNDATWKLERREDATTLQNEHFDDWVHAL